MLAAATVSAPEHPPARWRQWGILQQGGLGRQSMTLAEAVIQQHSGALDKYITNV